MNKNIPLYKFIIVGHLVINLPTILISFGLPALLGLLISHLLLKIIAIILGFIIGITASWLWWSYSITKWRLWAFSQVEENDMLHLKELAITHKLIWDDHSVFEKTEIRTKSENEQIYSINENIHILEQIEEINLDLNTPQTYGYRLSKKYNLLEFFAMILILFASVGVFFTDLYFVGFIIFLFMANDLKDIIKNTKYLRKLFINSNYLNLSTEGIQIGFTDQDFIEWGKIDNLRIDREKRMLILEMNNDKNIKPIKFELWRLDAYNYNEFNKNIKVFIERYRVKYFS